MELETTIDKLNKATEEFEEKDALHMEVNTAMYYSIFWHLTFATEQSASHADLQFDQ